MQKNFAQIRVHKRRSIAGAIKTAANVILIVQVQIGFDLK